MITTNNKNIYQKLLLYRSHGINKNFTSFKNKNLVYDKNKKPNIWYYEMDLLGFNYRITDLQAGLGASKLTKINTFTKKEINSKNLYDSFKNIKNLTTPLKKKMSIIHIISI